MNAGTNFVDWVVSWHPDLVFARSKALAEPLCVVRPWLRLFFRPRRACGGPWWGNRIRLCRLRVHDFPLLWSGL